MTRRFIATGHLDYLSHSMGARAEHYARTIANYWTPPGPFVEATRSLHTAVGGAVPLVGVGQISVPDLAEDLVAQGCCELVGMTRAQIADPDLVRKLAGDVAGPVRPCVHANQGCVDRVGLGAPITCFHNPDVGQEATIEGRPPAGGVLNILVAGGGPAGLKAAEAARLRGHHCVVYEAAPGLGGRLALLTGAGPAEELAESTRWLAVELIRLGAAVHCGRTVDRQLLAAVDPDAVVLATGATPVPHELGPHDGSIRIVSPEVVMASASAGELAGQRVVVVDNLGNHDVGACRGLCGSWVAVPHLSPTWW